MSKSTKKIKVIKGYDNNVEDWEDRVNKFYENNKVTETKTHVVNDEGCILYVAICFYEEEE